MRAHADLATSQEKLAVGPAAAGVIDIRCAPSTGAACCVQSAVSQHRDAACRRAHRASESVATNLHAISVALRKPVEDLTVRARVSASLLFRCTAAHLTRRTPAA
jgi:fructose-1,6-bisphosphatase/sedoheptulose 1,7-bisphosphatase-like protein